MTRRPVPRRDQILADLREHGTSTAKEVAVRTGLRASYVTVTLTALWDKRTVSRYRADTSQVWRWTLAATPDPPADLEALWAMDPVDPERPAP